MGSTSSVSMLPRPSRLKSLESELSPVFTTPPPVEPNTVFVLMSVPEMMLSSNLVAVRRRAANSPAMSAMMPSTAAPIAHVGVLLNRSSKNEGSGFADALTALAGELAVFGGGVSALAGSAVLAVADEAGAAPAAFAGGALVSAAFVSGGALSAALVSAALVSARGAGVAGGVTTAGAVAAGATAAGATAGAG